MTNITQVLDSMENALRLQIQAGAERRAAKAEREQGIEGISASQLLEDMDRIIGEAESGV